MLRKLKYHYKGKGLKEIDFLTLKTWISFLTILNEDITEMIQKGSQEHYEHGIFDWWITESNSIIEQIGEILSMWT